MCHKANPEEPERNYDTSGKQTFEIRSADGSADPYQMLAGICVGLLHGLEMTNALEMADHTYVAVNIHDKANEKRLAELKSLPDSCAASADCLEKQREVFERYGIFSKAMIDGVVRQLRSYNDRTLRHDVALHPEEIAKLVHKYFQCG